MSHVLKVKHKTACYGLLVDATCTLFLKKNIDNSSKIVDLPNSRASCQKIIEEKVTPILAEIVAFLDTNNNTMILESSEKTWITNLWLGIFNITDVEDIEKNTSGEHFSANFPFSWIIYGTVEKIIHVTSENAIGSHTILYIIFLRVLKILTKSHFVFPLKTLFYFLPSMSFVK